MKCPICNSEIETKSKCKKRIFCSVKCKNIYGARRQYEKYKELAPIMGIRASDIVLYGYTFLKENPEVVETIKVINSLDTRQTKDERNEVSNACKKRYINKDKEKYKAKRRKYYADNKEKYKEWNRANYLKNKNKAK